MDKKDFDYLVGQYDFYRQKGLDFYLLKVNVGSYEEKRLMCLYEQEFEKQLKNSPFDISQYQKLNNQEFQHFYQNIENIHLPYFFKEEENRNLQWLKEYFIHYSKNNPESGNYLVKNSYSYTRKSMFNFYEEFLSAFDKSWMEKIILGMTQEDLDVEHISPKVLDNLLIKKGFTEDESLNFWKKFVFKRKRSLKDPKVSYEYSDFLYKKFKDEDKLNVFFDSLPQIKRKFHDIRVDINEDEQPLMTSISIHVTKIMALFLIRDWDEKRYHEFFYNFLNALQDFLPESQVESYIDHKHMRLFINHQTPEFDNKALERSIVDFLNELKNNDRLYDQRQEIVYWLQKRKIENQLERKELKNQKIKI